MGSEESTAGPATAVEEPWTGKPPEAAVPKGLLALIGAQVRSQTRVSLAAVGALGTAGRLVLQLGALLVVTATIAGVTVAKGLFEELGLNVFDFVSITDLPTLGVRFPRANLVTIAILVTLGVISVLSALSAAHAVQSHRTAIDSARHDAPLSQAATFVSAGIQNARGYLMLPVVLAFAFVMALWQMLGVVVDKSLEDHLSSDACVYEVIWEKGAWEREPPFPEEACAALIGIFGTTAVFVADGHVHAVQRTKIGDFSRRVHSGSAGSPAAEPTASKAPSLQEITRQPAEPPNGGRLGDHVDRSLRHPTSR